MKQAMQVLLANEEQAKQIGIAMGRAFRNEPNFTYSLSNESKREDALRWFFGVFMAKLGSQYGRVYTTTDRAGGAVWMAPGTKVALGGALRAGVLSMPRRFGWGGLKRSMEINGLIGRLRKRVAPEEHWYLMALGVDPAAQGQGIGSALIAPVLADADETGTACYLETFSERNVAFYRRFGFEVVGEEEFSKGAIRFWGMTRKPRRLG